MVTVMHDEGIMAALISLCSVLSGLITAVITIITMRRRHEKEMKTEGEEFGNLLSEIKYIRGGVDELKEDSKDIKNQVVQNSKDIARHDALYESLQEQIKDLRAQLMDVRRT